MATAGSAAVWVNEGVLSPEEMASLRRDGVDLTSISHPLDTGDPDWLVGVLATIVEHHPGQRIWVEMAG